MDTPEIFYESLSKGIITYEMLDLALFSLNKRAKNYRDQKRKAKKSLYAQAQLFGFSNPDNPEEAERILCKKGTAATDRKAGLCPSRAGRLQERLRLR